MGSNNFGPSISPYFNAFSTILAVKAHVAAGKQQGGGEGGQGGAAAGGEGGGGGGQGGAGALFNTLKKRNTPTINK